MPEIDTLFLQLSNLPEVEAIALGGSRAGNAFDSASDYDVYIYCTKPIEPAVRRALLRPYCSYMEIDNRFWEPEDDCVLNNGIDIELIYRNLDDFISDVGSVVEGCFARNGYTTCMWHNLIHSRTLFDHTGRLTTAIQRFSVPYPEKLRRNIILRNMQLLRYGLPAYSRQLMKAAKRRDTVSINHRSAAFLESYFDVILAVNRLTHPGEKRLVSLCRSSCSILPDRFEENLEQLFAALYDPEADLEGIIESILSALEQIIPVDYLPHPNE